MPVFDLTLALDLQACGIVPDEPLEFGACDFEFEYNVAEPFDDIRGDVARVYLYFQAAYGMELTDDEEQQFEAWHLAVILPTNGSGRGTSGCSTCRGTGIR